LDRYTWMMWIAPAVRQDSTSAPIVEWAITTVVTVKMREYYAGTLVGVFLRNLS
jgi:hypothetical protein